MDKRQKQLLQLVIDTLYKIEQPRQPRDKMLDPKHVYSEVQLYMYNIQRIGIYVRLILSQLHHNYADAMQNITNVPSCLMSHTKHADNDCSPLLWLCWLNIRLSGDQLPLFGTPSASWSSVYIITMPINNAFMAHYTLWNMEWNMECDKQLNESKWLLTIIQHYFPPSYVATLGGNTF